MRLRHRHLFSLLAGPHPRSPRSRVRARESRRRFSILLFLCLSAIGTNAQQPAARPSTSSGSPALAGAHKKPITHDVYDSWKSIQGTKLSRDGVWLAYALTPQDGDGELVVRNLKTSAEYRAPRGRDPIVTPDGRFVVFATAPVKADVDKARKAKKKPEE